MENIQFAFLGLYHSFLACSITHLKIERPSVCGVAMNEPILIAIKMANNIS